MEHLVAQYGYWVLLVGTFLEGETILVIAGFLAHRGYLELPWVIGVAFAGSYAGDQLLFHLGRRHGRTLLERWPHWSTRTEQVLQLLQRHHLPIVLGFRFLYGLRTITPFAIGMSGLSPWRFLLLNGISALAWASVFATLGDLFGSAMESLLGQLKQFELALVGLIAGIGITIWLVGFLRRRLR